MQHLLDRHIVAGWSAETGGLRASEHRAEFTARSSFRANWYGISVCEARPWRWDSGAHQSAARLKGSPVS